MASGFQETKASQLTDYPQQPPYPDAAQVQATQVELFRKAVQEWITSDAVQHTAVEVLVALKHPELMWNVIQRLGEKCGWKPADPEQGAIYVWQGVPDGTGKQIFLFEFAASHYPDILQESELSRAIKKSEESQQAPEEWALNSWAEHDEESTSE
ncbi:MAG: hypothetical protein LBJ77_02705 [Holosporales bacterium]|nr:hypothetical protein [Holosporales bacterium]